MPQQATRINLLDRGDGSQIRIDWIGDVFGRQYKDVRVVTSRWTPLRKWTDTSHGDAVETVHIPIAYLRFLRVGDIWEGGVCQASQVVATASFPDVLIDESTSEILPSGARVIDKGVEGPFLLPFGFFDGHREHTTSLVTRIRVNASTSLVVPCMELVRFYFGASSSLLRGIFAGALARRELIKGSSINRVTGNANVALPEGIDSSAATAIARIAFDAAAERALNMLVQSGVAASVDGRKWYPRMGFPLRGRTTLNVKGLWFKQDGHETFLVHRLMSCTYPLPYKKLFYWKGTTAHDESRQARAVRRGAEKITLPAKAKVTLNNRPIFGSRQIVSLEAISEVDPFPDLARKPSIYAGNVLVVGSSRREAISEGPPRQLSAGGHCGPTTTGVDIIASVGGTVDEAAIPDLLWCMEAAVREVRPDVRALSFEDGRSMRRIWFGQSEVDGVGAFNGWIALLESEAASRFRTPTIALINAERQLDEGNAEFLMMVVSSQDPNDIVEKVQTFLRTHGWRTGGSKDAGVECVIALSTGEINEIVRRDPYEITNLVVSKC